LLKSFVGWNRKVCTALERRWPGIFSAPDYKAELERRIAADIQRLRPTVILEVGGIDRPLLTRTPGIEYIGLDIEEQPDCHRIYDRFIVQSIENPVDAKADMVISITLMEHVPNNDAAVRSMYAVLRPGGTTHHYVPSKWHPYSLALRLVGPKLQKRLIRDLRPAAIDVTGYPAFFDRCSPSAMSALFRSHGFADVNVQAFYGASDYFAFFVPAYIMVALFEKLTSALNWRFFASGFVLSAKRA
jgi:SAM-dependent methyltransferase